MLHHLYTFYLASAFIVGLFIAWNLNEFVGEVFSPEAKCGPDDKAAVIILFLIFTFVPALNTMLVLYLGECFVWGRKKYKHPS